MTENEPVMYTENELSAMKTEDIKSRAGELGYSINGRKKGDLVSSFLKAQEGENDGRREDQEVDADHA